MRRVLLGLLALALAGVAVWFFLVRERVVEPTVRVPRLTAAIGEGEEAVGVGAGGAVIRWLPVPEAPPLPRLPIDEVPEGGRLAGPVLEQARVLGAAPAALRPYLERSGYGEHGVEVELRGGIEIRFGDASRAARKWRAAAAVLADPRTVALDYVNVQSPSHPATGGSGHVLPSAP